MTGATFSRPCETGVCAWALMNDGEITDERNEDCANKELLFGKCLGLSQEDCVPAAMQARGEAAIGELIGEEI